MPWRAAKARSSTSAGGVDPDDAALRRQRARPRVDRQPPARAPRGCGTTAHRRRRRARRTTASRSAGSSWAAGHDDARMRRGRRRRRAWDGRGTARTASARARARPARRISAGEYGPWATDHRCSGRRRAGEVVGGAATAARTAIGAGGTTTGNRRTSTSPSRSAPAGSRAGPGGLVERGRGPHLDLPAACRRARGRGGASRSPRRPPPSRRTAGPRCAAGRRRRSASRRGLRHRRGHLRRRGGALGARRHPAREARRGTRSRPSRQSGQRGSRRADATRGCRAPSTPAVAPASGTPPW